MLNADAELPVSIVYICLVSTADICPVSAADICPVSTAGISISIHHSASAFSINNQHVLEAVIVADFWLELLAIASLGSDKIASRMRGGSRSADCADNTLKLFRFRWALSNRISVPWDTSGSNFFGLGLGSHCFFGSSYFTNEDLPMRPSHEV